MRNADLSLQFATIAKYISNTGGATQGLAANIAAIAASTAASVTFSNI
jgi:hypothetical protein